MPFRDIAGHRHLLELVAGAASRGSLPPSLIFAGPEGVGKRLAAVALAQFVNCASRGRTGIPTACGTCAACTRIARGVHADVLVVEPGDTGSIKIDQVREAIERTGYRPFEGRRRVVIVDDADAMQHVAQNALLKTLEEPPSASMFVLVTSRPDMLLPTVRSRCQRLRFGRLCPRGDRRRARCGATDTRRRMLTRRPRSRTAASASRSKEASTRSSRRARPRPRCCRASRRATLATPAGDARSALAGQGGSGRPAPPAASAGVDAARSRRARRRARTSGVWPTPTCSGRCRRLTGSVRSRTRDRGVCGGRSGARRARSQREPEDRRGLASVSDLYEL